MHVRLFLAVAVAAVSLPSIADTVVTGVLSGQPQIAMKDGRANGCGIRIIGLSEASSPAAVVSGFDMSFMVYSNLGALLKGLAMEDMKASYVTDPNNYGKSPKYTQLKTFWIKAPGHDATSPIDGKIIDGETPKSKLYLADFKATAALFEPIFSRTAIQVGIKRKGDAVTTIYSGAVAMTDDQVAQTQACMRELAEALQRVIDAN